MITVLYTEDSTVEGEDPPILWLTGKPKDYLFLTNYLHELGSENNKELFLNNNKNICIKDNFQYYFKSKKNSRTLLKKNGNQILIELEKELWIPVIKQILGVSFYPCYQYIESDLYADFMLDNQDFVEEGTIIISSDYQLIK